MRKDALMRALREGSLSTAQEPPERAVFLSDEESALCSSTLRELIKTSRVAPSRAGNRHALPLPDIELPMIF
jgi:hypothetical protein